MTLSPLAGACRRSKRVYHAADPPLLHPLRLKLVTEPIVTVVRVPGSSRPRVSGNARHDWRDLPDRLLGATLVGSCRI